MSVQNKSIKELRVRAARAGILTVTELARRVPCSRPAIYLALERPTRFTRVTRRIKELTEDAA